jgi:magnesium transporter
MTPSGEKHRRRPRPRGAFSRIGQGIDGAIGLTLGAVGTVTRVLGNGLRRDKDNGPTVARNAPGTPSGIEHMAEVNTPPGTGKVQVRCIDYAPELVNDFVVTDLDAFLKKPRPEGVAVRWVNIDGLHPFVVNKFREAYGFHTLAAEDVLHTHQRPRVEPYEHSLYIVSQMVMMQGSSLHAEQVSIFLLPGTVLTFQETAGDVWDPIRERIHAHGSRLRTNKADFLLYALIDSLVDHVFPILEHYGDVLEEIELDLLDCPTQGMFQRVHAIKRDLLVLRRALWPMRQMVDDLWHDEEDRLEEGTQAFFRDVHEHTVQIIDIIETYREISSGLTELYMSVMSQRLNEVMKVLTIIATIFVPLTFLAGVYGMNFKYLPELEWRWAYPMFWVVCLVTAGGLMWWFKRKGWIGSGR